MEKMRYWKEFSRKLYQKNMIYIRCNSVLKFYIIAVCLRSYQAVLIDEPA